jgi:hypothetical protein
MFCYHGSFRMTSAVNGSAEEFQSPRAPVTRPESRFLSFIFRSFFLNVVWSSYQLMLSVDCSGERLTCIPKTSGFWNTFSYNIMIKTCKIHWGIPCRCPTIRGASWNVTSLYQYIIPKFLQTFWSGSAAARSPVSYERNRRACPIHRSCFCR